MRIGEVAERTGASVRSLRYYEQQGLLESTRTAGGQRQYAEVAVERVLVLQQFYAAGLSSATIRELLPSLRARVSTPESRDRLHAEKARLDECIAALEHTRERLEEMIELAQTPNPHCPAVLGSV
jgi:DNA-binding transcriptional MerR regulator